MTQKNMTVDEAVALIKQSISQQKFQEAENICQQVLAVIPDHQDVIQLMSNISNHNNWLAAQTLFPSKNYNIKRVLNVGGNSKAIPLPPQYADFEHLLLDIDPKGSPDIVCDARKLATLEAGQFDAVYCSHNLEHYYRHDVQVVLAGFLHVLKDGGFAHILVPDIYEVMRVTIERGLDIDDVLYQSPAGPIMVLDVLYGYSVEIERSGQDFFAHKTGFTQKSLLKVLLTTGFSKIYSAVGNLEINALAFKGTPDHTSRALFGLPQE